MTNPTIPDADPNDVAEQRREDDPPDDPEAPASRPTGLPFDADEADVAEQRTEIPDSDEDDQHP